MNLSNSRLLCPLVTKRSPWFAGLTAVAAAGCTLPAVNNDVPNPSVVFADRVAIDGGVLTDSGIADMDGLDVPNAMGSDVLLDGSSRGAQIRAVQTAPAGMVNLQLDNVLVTYLVPSVPMANATNDPAGFTVQTEGGGPALFIAIDPATLAPRPAVGDRVSFRVTTTRAQNASASRWVLTLSNFTRAATGISVDPLVQDISSSNSVVTSLSNIEYQLTRLTATLSDNGTNSGSGFRSFAITTAGYPAGDPNLRMRLPESLATTLGLRQGCRVTAGPTPLWRFTAQAQPAAWDARDLMVSNCGAMADGGSDVPNAPTDVPNADVPNADAMGCNAVPIINELQTGVVGAATNEFVELYNPGDCAVNLANWSLRYASSNAMAEPGGTTWRGVNEVIAARGYVVLGSANFSAPGVMPNGMLSSAMADSGGGVGLYDPGNRLVNAVAWAQTAADLNAMHPYRSGMTYAAVPPANLAAGSRGTARVPNGTNTGNQGADFQARSMTTPGAANP
jgi:hypothetical protein